MRRTGTCSDRSNHASFSYSSDDPPPSHERRLALIKRVLLGALCVALTSSPATAQERPPKFAAFAAALLQSGSTGEFSSRSCPGGERGFEAGAILSVTRWLRAAAFARRSNETGREHCSAGLIPPPPDSGTVQYEDPSALQGYPYYALGARISAVATSDNGHTIQAFAGAEQIPGKDLLVPFYGVGFGVHAGPLMIVVNGQRRRLAMTVAWAEVTYRNGQVSSLVQGTRERLAHRYGVHVGVEIPLR